MAGNQNIYEVLIRFGLDDAKAKEAAKELGALGGVSKKASADVDGLGSAMKGLGQVAASIGVVAAIKGMMSQYQQAAGMGESTSRRWALANRDIEMSMVDIGRSIERQVLPYLEKAAGISKQIGNFTQKNPAVVENGLKLVAGAAGMTGLAAILSRLGLPGGIIAAAAGVQLAERQVFKGAGDKIGEVTGNKQFGDYMGKQLQTILSAGTGDWTKGLEEVAKALGLVDDKAGDAADATEQLAGAFGVAPEEMRTYIGYLRQVAQAEMDRGTQVYRANRDFNRQELIATQDYNMSRSRGLRDFNLQLGYQEKDYNRQRMLSIRDFNIQLARGEEDFNRQRTRAQADYQYGLWDIMRSGDALAYMRSQHDFKLSQSRAEEDRNIQVSRSKEDFNRSLSDQETQYNIQRDRTLVQFDISRADQEYDFKRQRDLAKKAFDLQQADAAFDYGVQRSRAQQAFDDQLRDANGYWSKMKDTTLYFTGEILQKYRDALTGALTGSNLINPTYNFGTNTGTSRLPSGYTDYLPKANGGDIRPGGRYLFEGDRPEVLQMGANGHGQVYPQYGSTGKGGGTWNVNVAVSGELTPSLRAGLRQEIIDLVSSELEAV